MPFADIKKEIEMSNPTITLTEFLAWLQRKPAERIVDVGFYCRERFNSRSVRVHPKEIQVSFRYAWTDTYTPDEGLSALIQRAANPMPAGEMLELAETIELERLSELMKLTEHLEPIGSRSC